MNRDEVDAVLAASKRKHWLADRGKSEKDVCVDLYGAEYVIISTSGRGSVTSSYIDIIPKFI